MELEVTVDVRLFNSGKLHAFAEASFVGPGGHAITIKEIRVMENKSGGFFVSLPQITYEKGGSKVYKAAIELGKPIFKAVVNAVMADFERQRAK